MLSGDRIVIYSGCMVCVALSLICVFKSLLGDGLDPTIYLVYYGWLSGSGAYYISSLYLLV